MTTQEEHRMAEQPRTPAAETPLTEDSPPATSALLSPAAQLLKDIRQHVMTTLGNDYRPARKDTFYNGLAYSIRDRLANQWLHAQRNYYDQGAKRVYYLSMEFLPGRFLMNYITNMQLRETVEEALKETGFTLEELATQEWDAGLGNGGLGRLASCFMDSLATLRIPGYGYGIHYDYGLFFQSIKNGYQVEHADNWVRQGNPWEIARRGFLSDVHFGGYTEAYTDAKGNPRKRWKMGRDGEGDGLRHPGPRLRHR
jgi:glycogen phosphorylase